MSALEVATGWLSWQPGAMDRLFQPGNTAGMIDLNDLRVFERVAALGGFSVAARALGLPKSSVSRSIARLEAGLGARLLQRTTREVALTPTGEGLRERCVALMGGVGEALDYVGGMVGEPRGPLKISSGIGFGINVLAEQLPAFLLRYPAIDVSLDLGSGFSDLVAAGVDVAVRLGSMPDSGLVSRRLGGMRRYLCAAPGYLARCGTPRTIAEIAGHATVEMPASDGRARVWRFSRSGEVERVEIRPRVEVNEALTIQRLVVNGVGLGIVSAYLCAPDIAAGRLVSLFPDWTLPPVEVSVVFPSRRELAPAVRAFIDFMTEVSKPGEFWQKESYR